MLRQPRRNLLVILAAGLTLSMPGCTRSPSTVPVDPEANFAAHTVDGRFALDRMTNGHRGVLEDPGWLRVPNEPAYVLRVDGETRAALWRFGRSRVLVRRDASTIAPRAGEAIATWDDGAIRLTLHLADASALHSDVFSREGGGGGPTVLTRSAGGVSGREGAYRAALRDGSGKQAGWLRVRLEPDEHAARIYDGRLPPAIDDAVAAAAVLVLDGELGWLSDKH
jgi:hypothetical protein